VWTQRMCSPCDKKRLSTIQPPTTWELHPAHESTSCTWAEQLVNGTRFFSAVCQPLASECAKICWCSVGTVESNHYWRASRNKTTRTAQHHHCSRPWLVYLTINLLDCRLACPVRLTGLDPAVTQLRFARFMASSSTPWHSYREGATMRMPI